MLVCCLRQEWKQVLYRLPIAHGLILENERNCREEAGEMDQLSIRQLFQRAHAPASVLLRLKVHLKLICNAISQSVEQSYRDDIVSQSIPVGNHIGMVLNTGLHSNKAECRLLEKGKKGTVDITNMQKPARTHSPSILFNSANSQKYIIPRYNMPYFLELLQ